MSDEKFARGGYIEGSGTDDVVPFPSSGCIITAAQVRRLGLSQLEALNLSRAWFPVEDDGEGDG